MKSKQDNAKNNRLKKVYGVDLEYWKELSKNGCMICKRKDGRLCLDHIHQKGFKKMSSEEKRKYLRGSLCFMCNTSLKSFEKTVDGLRNRQQLEGTVRYFKKYKLKGEV